MGMQTRRKKATVKKGMVAEKYIIEVSACPSNNFPLFEKLPEHVRLRIVIESLSPFILIEFGP